MEHIFKKGMQLVSVAQKVIAYQKILTKLNSHVVQSRVVLCCRGSALSCASRQQESRHGAAVSCSLCHLSAAGIARSAAGSWAMLAPAKSTLLEIAL